MLLNATIVFIDLKLAADLQFEHWLFISLSHLNREHENLFCFAGTEQSFLSHTTCFYTNRINKRIESEGIFMGIEMIIKFQWNYTSSSNKTNWCTMCFSSACKSPFEAVCFKQSDKFITRNILVGELCAMFFRINLWWFCFGFLSSVRRKILLFSLFNHLLSTNNAFLSQLLEFMLSRCDKWRVHEWCEVFHALSLALVPILSDFVNKTLKISKREWNLLWNETINSQSNVGNKWIFRISLSLHQ